MIPADDHLEKTESLPKGNGSNSPSEARPTNSDNDNAHLL